MEVMDVTVPKISGKFSKKSPQYSRIISGMVFLMVLNNRSSESSLIHFLGYIGTFAAELVL
jgi:hypothetical protein